MKLIAHRGASLECPENSLESLIRGSQLGAYAVECDLRRTSDGKLVIFHDDDLKRLAGVQKKINEVTLDEMRESLTSRGHFLLTLDDILDGYRESASVLLHIKLTDLELPLLKRFLGSPVRFIFGVQSEKDAALSREVFPADQILAFMPKIGAHKSFFRAGAGNIRLWEHWLDILTPGEVKRDCPGCEVWIMSHDKQGSMNGSRESLNRFSVLGVDGVLLNDIRLGTQVASEK